MPAFLMPAYDCMVWYGMDGMVRPSHPLDRNRCDQVVYDCMVWYGMDGMVRPSHPLDRNRCDQVVAAGSGAS
jgi:hypothetical protein